MRIDIDQTTLISLRSSSDFVREFITHPYAGVRGIPAPSSGWSTSVAAIILSRSRVSSSAFPRWALRSLPPRLRKTYQYQPCRMRSRRTVNVPRA